MLSYCSQGYWYLIMDIIIDELYSYLKCFSADPSKLIVLGVRSSLGESWIIYITMRANMCGVSVNYVTCNNKIYQSFIDSHNNNF